jgi:hypothetical protein
MKAFGRVDLWTHVTSLTEGTGEEKYEANFKYYQVDPFRRQNLRPNIIQNIQRWTYSLN